jgi:hypothetical protein
MLVTLDEGLATIAYHAADGGLALTLPATPTSD